MIGPASCRVSRATKPMTFPLRTPKRRLVVNGVEGVLGTRLVRLVVAIPDLASISERIGCVLVEKHRRNGVALCHAEQTRDIREAARAAPRAARAVKHATNAAEIDRYATDRRRCTDLVPAKQWIAEIHIQRCG